MNDPEDLRWWQVALYGVAAALLWAVMFTVASGVTGSLFGGR